jgi:hypothetical protein
MIKDQVDKGWQVEFGDSKFGERAMGDWDSPAFLAVLPANMGWRPIEREISLSHQFYKEKIESIFENYSNPRKIAIVNWETGDKHIVWERP